MFAFVRLHSALHTISRRVSSLSLLVVFLCIFAIMPLHAAESLPEIQQLLRQGQNTQALDKVNAYLDDRPRDAQGRFLKGLILTELKRHDEAIAVFTQLTEDYPELPEPYNNLAVLYAQQKQYDRARTALEMAIRTHPSYAIAYENLGDVYAKLASQAYDKALQLDTSNAAAQSKLALIRDLVSPPAVMASRAPQAPAQPPQTLAQAQPPAPIASVVATQPPAAPPQTPGVASASPPVAPRKPPAAETKPGRGSNDAAEITQTIAAWAAAWSQQNVRAYLGFYAPTFQPPRGMSRKAWEAEREARISNPTWIKVDYNAPDIQIDGDKATAHFRQQYQSSSFKSGSEKTLTFMRSGYTWLIVSEESN
ncbi:MAG: tetratricopeptide repeat protein [Betaproteobacteria bacterium]|nr:tetratricopeptide repeat protein [Betaproteobacteria bacterium]